MESTRPARRNNTLGFVGGVAYFKYWNEFHSSKKSNPQLFFQYVLPSIIKLLVSLETLGDRMEISIINSFLYQATLLNNFVPNAKESTYKEYALFCFYIYDQFNKKIM